MGTLRSTSLQLSGTFPMLLQVTLQPACSFGEVLQRVGVRESNVALASTSKIDAGGDSHPRVLEYVQAEMIRVVRKLFSVSEDIKGAGWVYRDAEAHLPDSPQEKAPPLVVCPDHLRGVLRRLFERGHRRPLDEGVRAYMNVLLYLL